MRVSSLPPSLQAIVRFLWVIVRIPYWLSIAFLGLCASVVIAGTLLSIFVLIAAGVYWVVEHQIGDLAIYPAALVFFGLMVWVAVMVVREFVTDPDNEWRAGAVKLLKRFGLYRPRRRAIVGYPDDWNDLRHAVYRRDGYACGNCGESDVELHAHHIVPLSRGGSNAMSNLTTLCVDCHILLHPHMRD